jgi:hypothetical protein
MSVPPFTPDTDWRPVCPRSTEADDHPILECPDN